MPRNLIALLVVATVLTVYGIETTMMKVTTDRPSFSRCNSTYRLRYWNMPLINSNLVSPASCNSTYRLRYWNLSERWPVAQITIAVATVLTVYGIETLHWCQPPEEHTYKLQQYLPFTVLKLNKVLQSWEDILSCNSTYRLRYWNIYSSDCDVEREIIARCNSTYRLRYWNYPQYG